MRIAIKTRYLLCISCCFVLSVLSLQVNALLQEQVQNQTVSSAYECTQVSLDDIDDALLTKEERLARMNNALSTSIDSYTSCIDTVQDNMSGGGSGASGGGASGASSAGGQGSNGNADGSGPQGEMPQTASQTSNESAVGSQPAQPQAPQNTTAPRELVPPKDNDSIICKLLFDEIQKAAGVSRTGLEKQYKDYQCGN